jgi:hypothetical protein
MVEGAIVQFRGTMLNAIGLFTLALHRDKNLLAAASTAGRGRG